MRSLRQIIDNRWLALIDLMLAIANGVAWMIKPELGFWFLLVALLSRGLRLIVKGFSFQRTSFDWFMMIFLVTAWVGYWASYDKTTAWSKVWLVVAAILLYYALSSQPKENLEWISIILFSVGVGVSIYFFLTHDFVSLPRKLEFVNNIGRWIMKIRPQLGWKPIHPNYVAGVIAITTPFVFYPAWKLSKNINRFKILIYAVILFGLVISFSALVMATSRGIVMAIGSAGGLWILWRIVNLKRSRLWLGSEAFFPYLAILYVCAVVAFLYAGPANSVGSISGGDSYGTGSRLELFVRSLYFLKFFPFTGGGLNSFPGLYSYYMLGIPFYYLPNSHNLFLDVAIEQGLLGGLSFLLIFIGSVWFVSRAIVIEQSPDRQVFNWLVLFVLVIAIIHGMVDDYLYNGNGTFLSLFLAGLSMIVNRGERVQISYKMNPWAIGFVSLTLIGILIINLNKLKAVWYADIGAVQMVQVELANFPNNGWAGSEILPKLEKAGASLHSSLQFDPVNQTANYYLGLISMLQADFTPASVYLETAHEHMPYNRGIIKSLGYSYVWLGNVDKAIPLLSEIPETKDELNVYVWWWGTQRREDLSAKASAMVSTMGLSTVQP